MNRDLANERVWQFRPIHFDVDADEFVSVTPFMPKDITVSNNSVSGAYGIDTFPNHKFTLLVNGVLTVYTTVESIPEHFDNVISFAPDDTHDITFTYIFKKDGKEFAYSHWVHHDMEIWERFLPELMKRETNGGWSHASSN